MDSPHMMEMRRAEAEMLRAEIRRNAVPADRCPCGAVRALECDYADRLMVWVSAEDVDKPPITTMKLCVQPSEGWESQEWVHRNCPSCDTAFGFIGRVPVIFPGMHHVRISVEGLGVLRERPDPPFTVREESPIPSRVVASEGDPYQEFEWDD